MPPLIFIFSVERVDTSQPDLEGGGGRGAAYCLFGEKDKTDTPQALFQVSPQIVRNFLHHSLHPNGEHDVEKEHQAK